MKILPLIIQMDDLKFYEIIKFYFMSSFVRFFMKEVIDAKIAIFTSERTYLQILIRIIKYQ